MARAVIVRQLVAVLCGASGGESASARERRPKRSSSWTQASTAPGTSIVSGPRCGIVSWPAARTASIVRRRGTGAPVEAVQPPLDGVPDEGEGVATEAARVAVDDGEHRIGCDRGVDGRAAGAKGLHPGRRRQRMGRGNHPVHG